MFNCVADFTKLVSYNYFIKSKYEAGIILLGWEVKCIRLGGVDLSSSYISFKNFNFFLIGSVIERFSFICVKDDISASRDKKLLLNKKENLILLNFINCKSHAIVPSKLYWKNSFLKVELCLCVGKKKYDKRRELKDKSFVDKVSYV